MIITTDAQWVGPWVCKRAGGTWVNGRGTAIGLCDGAWLTAGVLYEDWNGANAVCHIAGEGQWASRSFLGLIFDYPFNQLGVRRITVPVSSTNAKCIRLVRHMGFTIEATLRQATPDGDLLLFAMFREECKYLRGRYAVQGLSASDAVHGMVRTDPVRQVRPSPCS